MSTDKQEPRFSIAVDEEDVAQRAAVSSKELPPATAASGGGGFVLFMLTLLIVALAAAAYYLFDQLTIAQGDLKHAQQRLEVLEQRLSSADESLEENSVTTAVCKFAKCTLWRSSERR